MKSLQVYWKGRSHETSQGERMKEAGAEENNFYNGYKSLKLIEIIVLQNYF